MAEDHTGQATAHFSVRDLVLMAAISAVSAVAYAGLGQVWAVLTAATGPLGGVIVALFQVGHLVAGLLIRKKGSILATSILSTVVQAFLGDPAGIYVIGWGVAHGLGAECVFLLMGGYRNPRLIVTCVAAGSAAVVGHFFSYALYGWESTPLLFAVSVPILFLTSALESGLLAHWIAISVQKIQKGRA